MTPNLNFVTLVVPIGVSSQTLIRQFPENVTILSISASTTAATAPSITIHSRNATNTLDTNLIDGEDAGANSAVVRWDHTDFDTSNGVDPFYQKKTERLVIECDPTTAPVTIGLAIAVG